MATKLADRSILLPSERSLAPFNYRNPTKLSNSGLYKFSNGNSMKAKFFLRKIKIEFPQIKWKKYRILSHGWDYIVIVLDEKIIFRFPKNKRGRGELKNEARLLDYLKKKIRVGIPEYIFIAKNKSFAGYNLLKGQELKPSQFKRFAISKKEKFAKQIANFLTSLHSTPKLAISRFNVRTENFRKDYMKLSHNTQKFLFPRLNKKERQIIQGYLNELKATLDHSDYRNTLVHNDLTWEHILWDNKKSQVNIIDFGDRKFGDPASDFAGLWEFGSKLIKRVYELYRGKKDDKFLYRSQLYFKRIPLFIMKGALDGYPCTFKEGRDTFKKRFKIAKNF